MKKKVFALLLIAVMVLSSFSAVFAADATISTDSDTHTYDIYQIFTGDPVTGEAKKLENLKYGQNAVGTTGNAVSQADIEALNALVDQSNDQLDIDNIAEFVDITGTPYKTIGKGAESKSVTVPTGYYLIKDRDGSITANEDGTYDGYTLYLQKVVTGNLAITPKADKPSSEKKVDDVNDTTNAKELLKDSADYDIGDSVPYTLTATLPSNYTAFESYWIKFSDDMSKGLTFDGNATIYFGSADTTGTPITMTAGGTSAYDNGEGTVWTYAIDDLKTTAPNLGNNDVITIKYNATLNENAKIGAAGNPNKYCIEYSNNPNKGKDGEKGTTPWDVNIVFTYRTVVNKVDVDGNALKGADFKLEKKNADGTWTEVTRKTTDAAYPNATKFTFSGLDDGTYRLSETETPTGYNSIDPVEFTITADHTLVSDNPTLNSVDITSGNTEVLSFDLEGVKTETGATADIVNRSGSTLPETGGIGTTIIYILGAALVIGAGVMLVTRKKMNDR